MRKEVDAQIRFLPKEQQQPCAGSTDELVQVTDDAALVRKALFEILTREHTRKGAHVSQGSCGMMAPMFSAAGGMYPWDIYWRVHSWVHPLLVTQCRAFSCIERP
ncbi:hypothetical protein GOP47_0022356 [Adiantum capillus-veneris]|uniref:Uncharacterized protein n=1 Tax=Adiantum capillus-veneris TaxID=13818 RepID=A0A9D4U5L9_ADICA|nr:hypothetical protein GOP47_0022356 [Adiantum capillus-veneris]